MNMDADTEDLLRTQRYLLKIIPPILLAMGTVGNVLTIIVLRRKNIRGTSTVMFLTNLAVSDILVLYTGLLRLWLMAMFDVDFRTISELGCKINICLVYFSLQLSSWILVAVTIERMVGTCRPDRIKLGSPKNALVVVLLMSTVLLCLNAHFLFGMGESETIISVGNYTYPYLCVALDAGYRHFSQFVWPWIDMCVFALIPLGFLIIGNGVIVTKAVQSHRRTLSRVGPSYRNTGNTLNIISFEQRQTYNFRANSNPSPLDLRIPNVQIATQNESSRKLTSMTSLLVSLSVLFFICTAPVSVFMIGVAYWRNGVETVYGYARLNLWWTIVNLFMYTNNSVNFILYVFSAAKFRNELRKMIFKR